MSNDALSLPVIDACWNRIGIRGDRSCKELLTVVHCNNCPVFARAAQTLLDRPAQESYLAELSQFIGEPAVNTAAADQAVVLFSVGSERFAIASESVLEVAETKRPRPVPHRSNQVFLGLVNIRGQLELCMSLSGILGLPAAEPSPSAEIRVIVVNSSNQRWVLAIDTVFGVQRFHETDLLDVPPASLRHSNEYIRGLIARGDQHFGLIDLARLCVGLEEQLA